MNAVSSYGPVNLSEESVALLAEVDHRIEDAKLSDVPLSDMPADLTATFLEFGGNYPVRVLLAVNGTGLRTHMRADEIEVNRTFEVEGPEGDGGSGTRKQFRRLHSPFAPENEQVIAQVVMSYDGTQGNLVPFATDRIVRPHYMGGDNEYGAYHVGSEFPTPEEIAASERREVAYRQASDSISDRVEAAIKAAGHDRVHVIYSAYESDEDGTPIDNLDEVPVQGQLVLVERTDYEADEFDDEEYEDFESEVLESPTWLQLTVLANKMIPTVGDFHHVFLEGIYKTKEVRDGVPVYRFSMGS